MKAARVILGIGVLLMGSAPVSAAHAQEPAKPKPTIDFTLMETLSHIPTEAAKREDLREVPPPRPDKLSDSVRITVTVSDPRCLPGEEGWMGPGRLRDAPPRPGRSR